MAETAVLEGALIDQTTIRIKANEIIQQLTLLNHSFEYLDSPITLSGEFISKKSKEIKSLNQDNPLLLRVYGLLHWQQQNEVYDQLTQFFNEIEDGIKKASSLLHDVKICVESLKNLVNQMTDLSIQSDYLGIVSINNLKIATLEQKVDIAKKQLDSIDKFRTITLYHVSDNVKLLNPKVDDFHAEYNDLCSELNKAQVASKTFIKGLLLSSLVIFSVGLINFLANKYVITWTSHEYELKIHNESSLNSPLSSAAESIYSFINTLVGFSCHLAMFMSLAGIIYIGCLCFKDSVEDDLLQPKRLQAIISMILIFPAIYLARKLLYLNSDMYVKTDTITTISFFNLGPSFSYTLFLASLIALFYIVIYRNSDKQKSLKKAVELFNEIKLPESPK